MKNNNKTNKELLLIDMGSIHLQLDSNLMNLRLSELSLITHI